MNTAIMMDRIAQVSPRFQARIAGFLYLAVVITGFFSLAYVPSQITLSGDPRAAVNNLS